MVFVLLVTNKICVIKDSRILLKRKDTGRPTEMYLKHIFSFLHKPDLNGIHSDRDNIPIKLFSAMSLFFIK